MPNDIIKPKLGDYFTLYNFDISLVGDQYVGEAEKKLEKAAREYLESVIEDHYTYVCTVDPVYRYNNDLDLPIGQRVRLKSNLLDAGEKLSRVFAFEKNLATYQDTYTVGDKPTYYRLLEMDKTIRENKKITDLQYLEAMKIANFAYKNSKALNYLRVALENETSIEGGLILTSLIRLGMMVGDTWQEKAGVSGIAEDDEDIAFWAGGTLDQALNAVANPEATTDIAKYVVTHGGKTIVNDAFVRGKYQTAQSGERFEISPADKALYMYNKDNDISCRMNFSSNAAIISLFGFGGVTSISPISTQIGGSLTLDFDEMPTSDPEIRGRIWRNGKNIMISEG